MSTENNDLLDTDVSSIDTSFPRIVASTYELRIKGVELKPNNAGTGNNILAEFETVSEATSTEGEPIAAGFTIYHNFSLVKTLKYNPNKNLAAFMKAAKITGSPKAMVDNLQGLVGRTVFAKVRVQGEQNGFPAKNSIAGFEQKN